MKTKWRPLKYKLFLVLVLFWGLNIAPNFAVGQKQKLDSLIVNYASESDDSVKLVLAAEIFQENRNKDLSIAKKYTAEAIQISKKLKDSSNVLRFSSYYSKYLNVDSGLTAAKKFLSEAYRTYQTGDNEGRLIAASSLAGYYTQSNETEKGAEMYRESIRLAELLNNKRGLASANIGIATLFLSQKMYEEAKPHLHNGIESCNELSGAPKLSCQGVSFHNMALYFNKTNNCDSAIYYAEQSIAAKKQINNVPGIITSLQIKSNCELQLADTSKAIKSIQESIALAKKSPRFKKNLVSSQLHLANIYGLQKNKPDLFRLWEEIETTPNNFRLEDKLNYLTVKTNVLRLQGNYQEALETAKEKYKLSDSLRSQKNAAIVSEMENKYQAAQLQQEKKMAELSAEKAQLAEKNTRQTNIILVIFSILVIVLLGVLISRFALIKKQKKELNLAYEELETSKKNELAVSNLKALQSQMNPHFIFNALNSVQDLVLLQDIRNSNKYLGKFSDLIRKILLSSKKQFIPLDEEIEILSLYLDLEKLRFGEDFEIDFSVNINKEKQQRIELPAMFIQPYVENAIKHGLFHKEGKKKLKVAFELTTDYLECIVEDNGVGQEKSKEFKEKNLHLHTGFSTEAINDRIRLLNETLNKKILLEVEDLFEDAEAVGTRIKLRFPV